MKSTIKLLIISFTAGLVFTSCKKESCSKHHPPSQNTPVSLIKNTKELKYFDFSKDQVVEGGLSEDKISSYLADGWKTGTFIVDYTTTASFRNAGGLYFVDGIIPKGEDCIYNESNGQIIIILGGNQCSLQEEAKGFSSLIR